MTSVEMGTIPMESVGNTTKEIAGMGVSGVDFYTLKFENKVNLKSQAQYLKEEMERKEKMIRERGWTSRHMMMINWK